MASNRLLYSSGDAHSIARPAFSALICEDRFKQTHRNRAGDQFDKMALQIRTPCVGVLLKNVCLSFLLIKIYIKKKLGE